MPLLRDFTDFLEAEKNFIVTLLVFFMGVMVTLDSKNLDMGIAKPWVDTALFGVGFYLGHRIEAGKQP